MASPRIVFWSNADHEDSKDGGARDDVLSRDDDGKDIPGRDEDNKHDGGRNDEEKDSSGRDDGEKADEDRGNEGKADKDIDNGDRYDEDRDDEDRYDGSGKANKDDGDKANDEEYDSKDNQEVPNDERSIERSWQVSTLTDLIPLKFGIVSITSFIGNLLSHLIVRWVSFGITEEQCSFTGNNQLCIYIK